jgi:hypothetical protein
MGVNSSEFFYRHFEREIIGPLKAGAMNIHRDGRSYKDACLVIADRAATIGSSP